MRTTRLATFAALILLTASAAQAGSFSVGGLRVTFDDGLGGGSWCGLNIGDRIGCGRPSRPLRTCYNFAGRPYQTTLPRCPIS